MPEISHRIEASRAREGRDKDRVHLIFEIDGLGYRNRQVRFVFDDPRETEELLNAVAAGLDDVLKIFRVLEAEREDG